MKRQDLEPPPPALATIQSDTLTFKLLVYISLHTNTYTFSQMLAQRISGCIIKSSSCHKSVELQEMKRRSCSLSTLQRLPSIITFENSLSVLVDYFFLNVIHAGLQPLT